MQYFFGFISSMEIIGGGSTFGSLLSGLSVQGKRGNSSVSPPFNITIGIIIATIAIKEIDEIMIINNLLGRDFVVI